MTLAPPPEPLPAEPSVVTLRPGLRLVRFFDPARGDWDSHRFFGPLPDIRFDHHPPPCALHERFSVWYAATSLRGAVAEVFGRTGFLDREAGYKIAVTTVRAPIQILDLLGVAARQLGATQEIATSTDYAVTQAWARAFYEQVPDHHGIRWRGRQIGSISVMLNDRARMTSLSGQVFALDAPEIWPRIARAARDCGLTVL